MDVLYMSVPILIILLAPMAPKLSFTLLDQILFRLLLLVALLFAIRQSPMLGFLTLLAVFSIIIERNHYILVNLPGIPSTHVSADTPGKPMQVLPDIPELQYDSPHAEDVGVTVSEKDGDALYESASDLEDSQLPFKEAPSSDESPRFFESRGLA